jgi:dipeptidyl aminopeptidase/acylaminoacyl peptidase
MSATPESTINPVVKPARRRRWLIWVRRIVVGCVVAVALLIYGVFPVFVSYVAPRATTRPWERDLTSTPADSGAPYDDVEFTTADGVRLSGWLLPSGDRRTTIIFAHGLARSRRELLERAVALWREGYGALLYDSRNHGKSGAAPVTLGYTERLDVEAAVRFLTDEKPSPDRIVLFGISMGAAASLLAAAETPQVDAVIADSSFLSLGDTIDHHIRLLTRLPAFPLGSEVRTLLRWRNDIDVASVDALDATRRLGDRPAMFIAGAHDPRMPAEIARTLYRASTSSKSRVMIAEGPDDDIHGHAYDVDPERYIREISDFLKNALP